MFPQFDRFSAAGSLLLTGLTIDFSLLFYQLGVNCSTVITYHNSSDIIYTTEPETASQTRPGSTGQGIPKLSGNGRFIHIQNRNHTPLRYLGCRLCSQPEVQ